MPQMGLLEELPTAGGFLRPLPEFVNTKFWQDCDWMGSRRA